MRDPGEAAILGLERGDKDWTSLLSVKRGIRGEIRDADEASGKLMDRLRETFVVQRAARFAHVEK